MSKPVIFYRSFAVPHGPLLVGFTDQGICFAHFIDDTSLGSTALKTAYPNAQLIPGTHACRDLNSHMDTMVSHLIDSGRAPVTLPIEVSGTPFQQKVWRHVQTIPPGTVTTYQNVADGIALPRAVRAVASACARNEVALFIPCHRVICSDGSLGGYRWGIDRKRALLGLERRTHHIREGCTPADLPRHQRHW